MRARERRDFFVERIRQHFYAHGCWTISQQAPLSVGMREKSCTFFPPLGQKVRSSHQMLQTLFTQRVFLSAAARKSFWRKQCTTKAVPPKLRLFLYEIRPQVALLRQQLPSAPKRDARAQPNRTCGGRHLPACLQLRWKGWRMKETQWTSSHGWWLMLQVRTICASQVWFVAAVSRERVCVGVRKLRQPLALIQAAAAATNPLGSAHSFCGRKRLSRADRWFCATLGRKWDSGGGIPLCHTTWNLFNVTHFGTALWLMFFVAN